MNLHLTGHHIDLTPAIREYVSGKLKRLTRHFDHVIDLHAYLSMERGRCRIEASVHVRGREIFCENVDAEMYAAIDGLADKLDRAIIRHKEKSIARRHSAPPLKRRAAG